MLVAQDDRKHFFRIQTGSIAPPLRAYGIKINDVWVKIEALVIIIEKFKNKIYAKPNSELDLLIMCMQTIAENFYFYFGIINSLIEKINTISKKGEYKASEEFEANYADYKKSLGKKISIIRNQLFMHYEKPDFHEKLLIVWSSADGAMDLKIKTKNETGAKISWDCNPLIDGKELKKYLQKLF